MVAFVGDHGVSRCDDPGPLPGEGWALSAVQGKRGSHGSGQIRNDFAFNVTPAREWLTSLASEGRDHAEPLAAYEDELEFLLACEGPSETDLERIGHLLAAINTILPESIGDCITKLRMLAHSSIGIAVGDREDDVHSIEQVIGFLAQGWFIG
jgi:hypothetical protein